jgi:hypothetical protein
MPSDIIALDIGSLISKVEFIVLNNLTVLTEADGNFKVKELVFKV